VKWNKTWGALLVCGMSLGFLAAAVGDTISLQDNNSTFTIDPTSPAGANSWTVNGVNQLAQEWFWFQVNGSPQASIDTLGGLTISDTTAGGNIASVAYSSASQGLSANIFYVLTGGATIGQASNLSETISLSNISGSPETVSFYAYSNFNLDNDSGDVVSFPNANTVLQTKDNSYQARTVMNPAPDEFEGDYFNTMLTKLNGPGPLMLSNTPAIGSAGIGPGNMTSTCEWDMTIGPGDIAIINLDKQLTVVPEPGTLALLCAGAAVLLGFAWRRRR